MREGGASAPSQLQRADISAELRALLWDAFCAELTYEDKYGRMQLRRKGVDTLRLKHVKRDHRPADEFTPSYKVTYGSLKSEFFALRFPEFYGLVEWLLRNFEGPSLSIRVADALLQSRAPFRVLDGDTLAPVATPEEFEALKSAIRSAEQHDLHGAVAHLKAASSAASSGRWADSIRESVHAVETTAVNLEPSAKELGPALNKLEQKGLLHAGLKNGFKAIYGYASDENGVRHAIFDSKSANTDEADALFMIGACAAFVSYLIAKGRSAGLF